MVFFLEICAYDVICFKQVQTYQKKRRKLEKPPPGNHMPLQGIQSE